MEGWHNIDDGEPIPAWVGEVAVVLNGGRFAVETREGTRVAELGDVIVRYRDGEVQVIKFPPLRGDGWVQEWSG
jgi:hypothetical protein